MGWTKQVNGDDHIIFHVGKELPQEGSNFLFVPGKQNAQGRGIYCSEEVQTKYSGGEYYKQELEVTPVFCLPMHGRWTRGVLKRDNNKLVYCSRDEDGAYTIDAKGMTTLDVDGGETGKLRYYFPTEISFYREPKEKVYDKFAGIVRSGELSYEEAIAYLQEHSKEDRVGTDILHREYERAFTEHRIPELPNFLRERESELRYGMRR